MANATTPFGFRENGLTDGLMPTFGVYTGKISASNANAIYGGDVAKPLSGGYFDVFTSATGGGPAGGIGGIFLPHFKWYSKSVGRAVYSRSWPGNTGDIVANTTIECKLLVARDAILNVRTSGASGNPVTQANIGSYINFSIGATPGNNLISAFLANDADMSATLGNYPFQIYDIEQPPDSDPTSINNIIRVRFTSNLVL
jgi:hypothetical protein